MVHRNKESPNFKEVREVHVCSLAALLGKVQNIFVALYVGGRGVDAILAQQRKEFGVEFCVVACHMEVLVKLPPHSHSNLSQDGWPCFSLGKVVAEYSECVSTRHVSAHLVHCIVCIEVGTDFTCAHNLYRSLVEMAHFVTGAPYMIVVGH